MTIYIVKMRRYKNFLKNINLLLKENLTLTQLVFYSKKRTYGSEYQRLFFQLKLYRSFDSLSVYFTCNIYLQKCKKYYWIVHAESKTVKPCEKTLWPLLSQGYRASTRRQFHFYCSVPRSSRNWTDRPRKDERLSWPCSHPVVLNPGLLDWESGTLTTRSLLHELKTFKK